MKLAEIVGRVIRDKRVARVVKAATKAAIAETRKRTMSRSGTRRRRFARSRR